MGDEEEPQCKVEYLDLPEGAEPEETNWIRRAGKCRVTYVNGCTFEGTFDAERIKQGPGVYVWMAPGTEEDESLTEKARYEGVYKDGLKHGVGKMVYPTGDVYEGEWFENKMQGEGTYTYKNSTDIYSGGWADNKKAGKGTYEFGKDSSVLTGEWVEGQVTKGQWVLKGAAVYEGEFKLGRPLGEGTFSFESGLTQGGSYVEQKAAEDEEPLEEG
ncbi:radial spoke protein 10, partial [Ochromonadaceae sp. CCMP2298]